MVRRSAPVNVVHEIAYGIDVHKGSLTACLLSSGAPGKTVKHTRSFSAMSYGLVRRLRSLGYEVTLKTEEHAA
jgi:hypothetical protein